MDKLHKHLCTDCGLVWEHSGDMLDNQEAHTCATCRSESWNHYNGEVPAGQVASPAECRAERSAIERHCVRMAFVRLFGGSFSLER
jgi:hypothetical protein